MPSFRERLRAVRPGGKPSEPDAETIEILVGEQAEQAEAPGGALLVEVGQPPASVVRAARRERAQLEQQLAQLRDDIGGLVIEMARRDHFNHALVERRAGEAVAVEQAIVEVEARVALAGQARSTIDAEPAAEPEPLPSQVTYRCARCGAGLVGDVNFCGFCGAARGDG